MPDDLDKKRIRSHLESLSTEKLRIMLLKDFMFAETESPDGVDIATIMEVIIEREQREPGHEPPDIEKAWADFQKYYLENGPMFDDNLQSEQSFGTSKKTKSSTPKPVNPIIRFPLGDNVPRRRFAVRKLLRHSRYAAAALLISAVLGGGIVASAFGINFFQAVANWTNETLGFSRTAEEADPSQPIAQIDPFGSLKARVIAKTDLSLVPNWGPDDTKADGEAVVTEKVDGLKFYSNYLLGNSGKEFSICFILYSTVPEEFDKLYQKDGTGVVELVVNGITHYLTSNNGNSVAMWSNGTAECMIQGDLTMEELERMVESIYEE